jgi:hypothetical protein
VSAVLVSPWYLNLDVRDVLIDPTLDEAIIFPNFVQYRRDQSVSGVGAVSSNYVGPLFVTVDGEDAHGIFVGARTSALGGDGRYGLFYTGVPQATEVTESYWLYGLRQNAENRTNLALVNTGEADASSNVFRVELFDGNTGVKVKTIEGISLSANKWTQIGTILVQAPRVTGGQTPSSPMRSSTMEARSASEVEMAHLLQARLE